MMMGRLFAISIFVAMPVAAVAGPFEDAGAAYNIGNYVTALQLYRPLAVKGDMRAQHILGNIYYKGLGVPKDDTQAVSWYRIHPV
jgi:TPR repeat protein